MPIKITTTTPGDGVNAKSGQEVKVHYIGTLTDGSEFDSSRKRGEPFVLTVGQGMVIKGWDQALVQMSKGQRAKVEIPPELGYGDRGYPPVIPEKATLIFDMELLEISK